jgi:hypothetical protein
MQGNALDRVKPLRMKLTAGRSSLALAVVLLWDATARGATPIEHFVPGTYRQIDTVTKKTLPVGNQVVIIAGKAGRLGFSVNAVRQIDTNQGFVAGTLPPVMPAVWTRTSAAGNCKLIFEGLPKGLKVTQDAGFGDCGFGYGVSASGIYALVPEKPLTT